MTKQLLLQGFTIAPVIHAVDLDADIPTIEAQQYGQQFVGPGELAQWATDQWPDLWTDLVGQYALAQAAAKNAEVEAARAAKPRKRAAKKP